jgi:hypothetical protein
MTKALKGVMNCAAIHVNVTGYYCIGKQETINSNLKKICSVIPIYFGG